MTLYGQEKNGTTWGLCKLNMLFHDILDAQIENGDTLNDPKHIEGAELKRFDIVIANPPFSQNYTTEEMRFKDRYQFWMPTKGKADFMFVQHMISTLKSTGRMAVIMPHGVLFRGGEERKMREWMIKRGYLEAIIGPRERELTSGFKQLISHYLFKPRFCLVRRANEKGVVEGIVGYSRQNFLVPVPQFESFDELNEYLCKRRFKSVAHGVAE